MNLDTLKLRLKHARKELRGMSQVALAKAAKITQPSVSELESGETKEISGPTLIAICAALRVRPEWMVTGEGPIEYQTSVGGLELRVEEAEAIKRLREGMPDWRRYVLSLAMMDKNKQSLMLDTMREAVPDHYVEQHFGTAPHVAKKTKAGP